MVSVGGQVLGECSAQPHFWTGAVPKPSCRVVRWSGLFRPQFSPPVSTRAMPGTLPKRVKLARSTRDRCKVHAGYSRSTRDAHTEEGAQRVEHTALQAPGWHRGSPGLAPPASVLWTQKPDLGRETGTSVSRLPNPLPCLWRGRVPRTSQGDGPSC